MKKEFKENMLLKSLLIELILQFNNTINEKILYLIHLNKFNLNNN